MFIILAIITFTVFIINFIVAMIALIVFIFTIDHICQHHYNCHNHLNGCHHHLHGEKIIVWHSRSSIDKNDWQTLFFFLLCRVCSLNIKDTCAGLCPEKWGLSENLLVQTSPCGEVWFKIWLKAHGKIFVCFESQISNHTSLQGDVCD